MALTSAAFPCNPRPFALRINELCNGNSGAITSDEAKACLWILNAMAYGQMAEIDMCDEWSRLNKALTSEEKD
jgi:hypothetical protein